MHSVRAYEKLYYKIEMSRAQNLRAVVGPRPSGWGVMHSKFSEANPILLKFYRRAAVFSAAFFATKKAANDVSSLY